MICACAQASEEGLRACKKFIDLILSGTLLRAGFVLESALVGLQKLTDGVPNGGVRPSAIGEVWYRMAMMCALTEVGAAVGASLAPMLVGVGTRGGVDAVEHAVEAALQAEEQNVTLVIDCENAFNDVSLDAVFTVVKEYMPQALPVAQWPHGAATPLHITEGTEPTLSQSAPRDPQDAVRAGDAGSSKEGFRGRATSPSAGISS